MIASDKLTKREILSALESKGEPLQRVREKFNNSLENNRNETILIANDVVEHIFGDLDKCLDMHPQV